MNSLLNWMNAHQDGLAFIVVCALVMLAYLMKKKARAMAVIGTAAYAIFILYKTVLSRSPRNSAVNLELGWSYRALINGEPGMFSQIYLNIMLFIPLGLFSGMFFLNKKKRSYLLPVAFGVILTVTIEFLQLTLQRGTFELDDIFNNTIGTIIGVFLAVIINRKTKKRSEENDE